MLLPLLTFVRPGPVPFATAPPGVAHLQTPNPAAIRFALKLHKAMQHRSWPRSVAVVAETCLNLGEEHEVRRAPTAAILWPSAVEFRICPVLKLMTKCYSRAKRIHRDLSSQEKHLDPVEMAMTETKEALMPE